MDSLVIYDQKRHRLLKQARWFKFVPYVDYVLLTGSLALGETRYHNSIGAPGGVTLDSDFDVLVIVKQRRLYAARFFCLMLFKLLGLRNHIKKNKSGFCFNHFVTPIGYQSYPQFSDYDRRLYKNMVLIFGNLETQEKIITSPLILEKILKWLQVRRIKKNIRIYGNEKSQIKYGDDEVRLWFNPKSDI